jgi:hypothetical protein
VMEQVRENARRPVAMHLRRCSGPAHKRRADRAVLCTPGWAGRLWQTVACSSLVAPLAPPIATGTLWSRFSLPNVAGRPTATATDGVGYIGGPETGHGVPGTSLAIACLRLAL